MGSLSFPPTRTLKFSFSAHSTPWRPFGPLYAGKDSGSWPNWLYQPVVSLGVSKFQITLFPPPPLQAGVRDPNATTPPSMGPWFWSPSSFDLRLKGNCAAVGPTWVSWEEGVRTPNLILSCSPLPGESHSIPQHNRGFQLPLWGHVCGNKAAESHRGEPPSFSSWPFSPHISR